MTIDGYCTLGKDREYDLTETSLLAAMDATGVEKAVIVPPDRNLAVYNREGNDSVLRAAHKHRTRFIPACSVNPWYGPPAVVVRAKVYLPGRPVRNAVRFVLP